LFLDVANASSLASPRPGVLRERTVKLNEDLLKSLPQPAGRKELAGSENERKFSLKLFEDSRFTAVADYFESPSPGTNGWTGHLAETEGTFSMVVRNTEILGDVIMGGSRRRFSISTRDGQTIVQEKLASDSPKKSDGVLKFKPEAQPPPAAPLGTPDDPFSEDVLVAYTPTAKAKAAAVGTNIELVIDRCIVQTNAIYTKSGVTTRLNLVFKGLIQYAGDQSASVNYDTILNELTAPSDGKLDDIHPTRRSYRADIVVLMTAGDDSSGRSGVSWGMDSSTFNVFFADHAFSVISWEDASGDPIIFPHEIGHIQGCDHPGGRGVWVYSLGRKYSCPASGQSYATIMAAPQGIPYVVLDYFSNPAVLYPARNGCPTGQTAVNEETKTINDTSNTVANFLRRTP